MFGLSNFVKDAFTTAKNITSSIFKPNTSTTTGPAYNPPPKVTKQPTPNMSTASGPRYAAPPVMSQATKVSSPVIPNVQPGQPITQPAKVNSYSQDQITQARVNSKMTDTVRVEPKRTVTADKLAPENTMSSLMQARKEMEKRFVEGLTPSDNLKKLAEIQNERADMEEQYAEEYKALKANPEGKLSGNLNAQLRDVKERQNDQLAKIAIREGIALGIVNLEKDQQNDLLKNIKEITALTQDDMVGSLQTDPVTGQISAFFRNPETGEMRQEVVGQTSIKPNYDIRTIDGRVVALDENLNIVKDLGASGSGSTSITNQMAQIPDFNTFLAQREQQLQMNLAPEGREALKKEYEQLYTSVINQTLANKFSKSEIGKLSAAGLIGADLNEQINFLYGKGGDDELMSLLDQWGTTE
jgi:hypothetical protein